MKKKTYVRANRAHWATKPLEPLEIRFIEEAKLEARLAREAQEALEKRESQAEREARLDREAQKALKAQEAWEEHKYMSGLRLAAVGKVKVESFIRHPSGGREFKLYCLACDQAGDKDVADYLHAKEAAKEALEEAATQALLQQARDEGGYG